MSWFGGLGKQQDQPASHHGHHGGPPHGMQPQGQQIGGPPVGPDGMPQVYPGQANVASNSSMAAVAQLFARLSQEIEEAKPKNCIHFIVNFLCKHYPEHLHGFASIWQMDPDLENERLEVVNFFKSHKISTAVAAHFTNAGYDTLDTLTTLSPDSLVDVEAFNNVKWLPGHKVRLQQIFSEISARVRAYRQAHPSSTAAVLGAPAAKPAVAQQAKEYVVNVGPPVRVDQAALMAPAVAVPAMPAQLALPAPMPAPGMMPHGMGPPQGMPGHPPMGMAVSHVHHSHHGHHHHGHGHHDGSK